MNAYDPEANYGPAFFDARHNFVLSANYELPYGRDRKWGNDAPTVMNAILGGWQGQRHIPGSKRASRSPSPMVATDRSRVRAGTSGRTVSATRHRRTRLCDHWLDINAFATVPLGTFGNCPIGVGRAPGYKNVDLTLAKRFGLGGQRSFEVRAEAFNLTNTPSFSPPARDISNVNTFGTITAPSARRGRWNWWRSSTSDVRSGVTPGSSANARHSGVRVAWRSRDVSRTRGGECEDCG